LFIPGCEVTRGFAMLVLSRPQVAIDPIAVVVR